MRNKIRYK